MANKESDCIADLVLKVIASGDESEVLRRAASEAFETVLAPAPDALSKELHSAVKFLWDQVCPRWSPFQFCHYLP